MKKKIFGILMITFSTLLIGCESSKIPEGMSKESYDIANEAIEVSQAYVDGNKTAASVVQTLSDLYDKNEKLLTKDSKTSTYDSLVSSYISSMQSHAREENSFDIVDDIEDMNNLLTPTEQIENLSDIIVGSWSFEHDDGWILKFKFNSDGTGTYDMYDDSGEYKSSSDFEYSIDDKGKILNSEYSDGSNEPWFQFDTITNKYMTYTMISPFGDAVTTGTAYKNH